MGGGGGGMGGEGIQPFQGGTFILVLFINRYIVFYFLMFFF